MSVVDSVTVNGFFIQYLAEKQTFAWNTIQGAFYSKAAPLTRE